MLFECAYTLLILLILHHLHYFYIAQVHILYISKYISKDINKIGLTMTSCIL